MRLELALPSIMTSRSPSVPGGNSHDSASEKAAAEGYARQLAAIAPYNEAIRILGPAEAPLALIRGRHRFRLLAKSARMFDLSGYLRDWFSAAPSPRGGVKVAVDVDPQSFL